MYLQSKCLTPTASHPSSRDKGSSWTKVQAGRSSSTLHQLRQISDWRLLDRTGCWAQKGSLIEPKIALLLFFVFPQEDSDK